MEFDNYTNYIIGLALLYRKVYVGTDKISFDKIMKYQSMISINLQNMNANINFVNDALDSDLFKIWSVSNNEDENIYFTIDGDINIGEVWNLYVKYLSIVMCMATLKDNALKEIDLIIVDGNIIDRNSYYDQLRQIYNLCEVQLPGFDIFREWEKFTEGGFVETCCLTDNERAVLNVMRKNKKDNGYVTMLRKIKKL